MVDPRRPGSAAPSPPSPRSVGSDAAAHETVPAAAAYVRDLMDGFPAPWFLCGGWAADTWLGRQSRDHFDVDISLLHRDQHAVFEHLAGWALVGHDPNVPDATTEPWNGRQLDMPAHIHVPELGSPLSTMPSLTHTAFEFEFLLNDGDDDVCLLNRERNVSVPLQRCLLPSPWGLPTAGPEVVLFFKGGGALGNAGDGPFRARDEQDFFALLPVLADAERTWLRAALATIRTDHPWLTLLNGRP